MRLQIQPKEARERLRERARKRPPAELLFVVEINSKELWVVSAPSSEAAAQRVHQELQDTRAPFAVSVLGQVKCVLNV